MAKATHTFQSPAKQARQAISDKLDLSPRHANKNDGKIHSIGTARSYQAALTRFARFVRDERLGDLKHATMQTALMYLTERQESGLSQKTLDQDRQAISCHLSQKIAVIHALVKTEHHNRAYARQQIDLVAAAQRANNSLSTEIAGAAGLRAHELLTLRPVAEQPASSHRTWSPARFAGRVGEIYTVVGKGGLVREVMIPFELAQRLEACRLAVPRQVVDRGVRYTSYYAIGGGKNWSTSYSRVAKSQLGWTEGAHGVRYTFGQSRMEELQAQEYTRREALAIVSQELGHFSPSTTERYLG